MRFSSLSLCVGCSSSLSSRPLVSLLPVCRICAISKRNSAKVLYCWCPDLVSGLQSSLKLDYVNFLQRLGRGRADSPSLVLIDSVLTVARRFFHFNIAAHLISNQRLDLSSIFRKSQVLFVSCFTIPMCFQTRSLSAFAFSVFLCSRRFLFVYHGLHIRYRI